MLLVNLLLPLAAAVTSALAVDDKTVIVDINTDFSIKPCQQLTIGLTVTPDMVLQADGNYSTMTLELLRALSPSYLRVNMEEMGERMFAKSNNTSEERIFTETEWIHLNELAYQSGTVLIISLDARTQFDPTHFIPLLEFLQKQGYSPAWQLQYNTSKLIDQSGTNAGRDISKLHRLLDSLTGERNVMLLAPDVPTCTSCRYTRFLRDYLIRAGPSVQVIPLQLNRENELIDEEIIVERVSKLIEAVNTKIAESGDLGSSYKSFPKELWTVETGEEGYSGGFNDALAWALRLGHTAKQGYQTVLHQPKKQLTPSPDFWVSVLYQRFVGRGILSSFTTDDSHVSVFTHCAEGLQGQGAVVVWGVNPVPAVTQLLLRTRVKQQLVYLYALTGDQEVFGDTFLNGNKLNLQNRDLSPKTVKIGPEMKVEIPASSVFFIVLPEANANACLNKQTPFTSDGPESTETSKVSNSRFEIKTGRTESSFKGGSDLVLEKGGLYEDFEEDVKDKLPKINPKFNLNEKEMLRKQGDKEEMTKIKPNSSPSDIDWARKINDLMGLIFNTQHVKEDKTQKDNKFAVIPRFKRSVESFEVDKSTDIENIPFYKKIDVFQRNGFGVRNNRFPKVLMSRNSNQYPFLREKIGSSNSEKSDLKGIGNKYRGNNSQMSRREQKVNGMKDTSDGTEDLHYRPGAFYKALKKLKLQRSEMSTEIEDPHDAIVSNSKDLLESTENISPLKVNKRTKTLLHEDRRAVESATEKIKTYFKNADDIIKTSADSCNNDEDMKCCEKHQHQHGLTNSKITGNRMNKEKSSNDYFKYDSYRIKRDTKGLNKESLQKNKLKTSSSEEKEISLLMEELTEEGEQLLKSVAERYSPDSKAEVIQDKSPVPLLVKGDVLVNKGKGQTDEYKPKQSKIYKINENNKDKNNEIKQERTFVSKDSKIITPLIKTEDVIKENISDISKQIDKQFKSSLSEATRSSNGVNNDVKHFEPLKEVINITEDIATKEESTVSSLLGKVIPQSESLVKTILDSAHSEIPNFKQNNDEEKGVQLPVSSSKLIKALLPTPDKINLESKIPTDVGVDLNSMSSKSIIGSDIKPIDVTMLKKPNTLNLDIKPIPVIKPVMNEILKPLILPPVSLKPNENHLNLIDDLSGRIKQLDNRLQLSQDLRPTKLTPFEEIENKRKQRLEIIRERLEKAREKILSQNPKLSLGDLKFKKKRDVASGKELVGTKSTNLGKIGVTDIKEKKNSDRLDDLKNKIKEITSKLQQSRAAAEKAPKKIAFPPPIKTAVVPSGKDVIVDKRTERIHILKERAEKAREKILSSSIPVSLKETLKVINKREISLNQNNFNRLSNKYVEDINGDVEEKNINKYESADKKDLNANMDAQETVYYKETVSPMEEGLPSHAAPINKWIIPLSNYTENIVLNNKMFPVKLYGILTDNWMQNVRFDRSSNKKESRREPRGVKYPCVSDNFNDFEEEEQNLNVGNSFKRSNKADGKVFLGKLSSISTKHESVTENIKTFPDKTNIPSKVKRSINSIERTEEVMKALLTNEIVKDGPFKDFSDQSVSDGIFTLKLQEDLSKLMENKTGTEKMLNMARQYQKINPNSLEIFKTNGGRIENNKKVLSKTEDNSEDNNRAIEESDGRDISIGGPMVMNVNRQDKQFSMDKIENTTKNNALSTETTPVTGIVAPSQTENVLSTVISKIQALFTAITGVVENSVIQ